MENTKSQRAESLISYHIEKVKFAKTCLQNKTELYAKHQKYASAPLRHLLPRVLKIMPRNPKYDQFHYVKWCQNKENHQAVTKI